LNSEDEIVFKEKLDADTIPIAPIDRLGPDKDLIIYELLVKQSDYKVHQERANWYPKISINKYYGAQYYRDDFGISFKSNDWSKVSNISLNVSIPIFNGFSTKNRVKSALTEYKISQNTLEYENAKSKIEDELILKEFNLSREAVAAANDNYLIARENANIQLQKFEQGIVSLDIYLDSFDDYLKTEVTYLNLLSDAYNYYSKILSRKH
jgi:outer membrane protein TolC